MIFCLLTKNRLRLLQIFRKFGRAIREIYDRAFFLDLGKIRVAYHRICMAHYLRGRSIQLFNY